MEDDHKTPSPSTSFHDRRMKSKLKISCFRQLDSHLHSPIQSPTLKKSPSSWFKSSKIRSNDTTSVCRHRSSGGTIVNRYRRYSTNEFKYDPLSYSLNFEEDGDLHVRNFMSRLPVTPPGIKKLEDVTRIEAVGIARNDRDVDHKKI